MAHFPSSLRSLFMAASCTCPRTLTLASSLAGTVEAKAPTRAISRTSRLSPSPPSESHPCHPRSWPNLRGLTLSWRFTRRTRSRWRRQTTRRTSFQKWGASPAKKWLMTTTRHSSTIWKITTRSPKDTYPRWARYKHMRKKCARLSTRWWNPRFRRLCRRRSQEWASKDRKNRKLLLLQYSYWPITAVVVFFEFFLELSCRLLSFQSRSFSFWNVAVITVLLILFEKTGRNISKSSPR